MREEAFQREWIRGNVVWCKKWKGGRRLARPGPPAKVSDQGISVCHQQTCGGQISGRKTSSSRSPPFMFPATDRTNHPRTLYSHLFLRSQWLRLWLYAQFSTKHRSPMYVRLMNIYSQRSGFAYLQYIAVLRVRAGCKTKYPRAYNRPYLVIWEQDWKGS